MKHFELIQDIFTIQALNDHAKPSFHHPVLITRHDLKIPDRQWRELRDNCFVQKFWNAYSITPKGAFFCEIAGVLDLLLDGPGGWPVEPYWWRRKRKDCGAQRDWCELCGAALPLPLRNANEHVDDISLQWLEWLTVAGSPRIRQGAYVLFDVKNYKQEQYNVCSSAVPYLDNEKDRLADVGLILAPKKITGILLSKFISDQLNSIVSECIESIGISVLASNSDDAEKIVLDHCIDFMKTDKSSDVVGALYKRKACGWVILLYDYLPLRGLKDALTGIVFNPGCLYQQWSSDKAVLQYEFFNLSARSLKNIKPGLPLAHFFPARKIVDLEAGFAGTGDDNGAVE
jgi:hypothetical protein